MFWDRSLTERPPQVVHFTHLPPDLWSLLFSHSSCLCVWIRYFWLTFISSMRSFFSILLRGFLRLVPTNLLINCTSLFSHYIICFHFLSGVTARQPIRIIKTTFKQFAAEFLIFLAWSLFPIHRCGMSRRELKGVGGGAWQHLTPILHLWGKGFFV